MIKENTNSALNQTGTLANENDHMMVKIELPGTKQFVTIHVINESRAMEYFIDREVCNK